MKNSLIKKVLIFLLAIVFCFNILNIQALAKSVEIEGLLKNATNVRKSPNGKYIKTYHKNEYIHGYIYGNWIKLDDGNYIYNSGLLHGYPINGHLKYDTNIRETINGDVFTKFNAGSWVGGKQFGNWLRLGTSGYFVYNFGLDNESKIKGYILESRRMYEIPFKYYKGTLKNFSYIEGNSNGEYIRLKDGSIIYDVNVINGKKISGYTTESFYVRKSPYGSIVKTIYKDKYIEGILYNNWIYLYDGNVISAKALNNSVNSKKVSGYISKDVNIRTKPNGKVIGKLNSGKYITGILQGKWIKLNSGEYIYNFGFKNMKKKIIKDNNFTIDKLNTKIVYGYLKSETNVRKSPNGKIFDTLPKYSFIKGYVDVNNHNWLRLNNNAYIRNTSLYSFEDIEKNIYNKNTLNKYNNYIALSIPNYVKIHNRNINNPNFVLVLDPGHGAGIEHNRGGLLFNEGDQNLKFTKRIIKEAQKYANLTVINTRPVGNEIIDVPLEERAELSNGADLFVSIHSNAYFDSSVRGSEVLASNYNTNFDFPEELVSTWAKIMNTNNRGVKYYSSDGNIYTEPDRTQEYDFWYVFQGNTAKEKYILESAFHSNILDSRAYLKNQDVLAKKFMEIVAKHFGLKKK